MMIVLIILNLSGGGILSVPMPDIKVCLEGAARINDGNMRDRAFCIEAAK